MATQTGPTEWEVEDESFILLDMGSSEAAKKLLLNSANSGVPIPPIEIEGINNTAHPTINIGPLRFEGSLHSTVIQRRLVQLKRSCSLFVPMFSR